MTDFRIDGLDRQLQRLLREAGNTERYDNLRYGVAKRFMDHCARTCGEESGQLVASFKRQPFNGRKEWVLAGKYSDAIEAGTKVFYARMVNDGHRLVLRRRNRQGKPIRGKRGLKEVGFVKGTHFMERALEQTNTEVPEMVRDFFRDVGKAAGFDVSG